MKQPSDDAGGEKLTVEEIGQLTRDLVLGHPTSVVLDNPIKLRVAESLRTDIERRWSRET